MSMLSAQCDELRAMAESVGLAMPQAATLMMEAADTIWELRCKCADLVDERERLFQANVEKNGEVLRLVNENAKLRELVAAYQEVADFPICKLYDERKPDSFSGACAECDGEGCLIQCLNDELRELGVDV